MSPAPRRRQRDVRPPGSEAWIVLTRDGAEIASWPVPGAARLGVVDELARLQLAVRRAGCLVALRDPGADLRALLDLAGLGGVIPSLG